MATTLTISREHNHHETKGVEERKSNTGQMVQAVVLTLIYAAIFVIGWICLK